MTMTMIADHHCQLMRARLVGVGEEDRGEYVSPGKGVEDEDVCGCVMYDAVESGDSGKRGLRVRVGGCCITEVVARSGWSYCVHVSFVWWSTWSFFVAIERGREPRRIDFINGHTYTYT